MYVIGRSENDFITIYNGVLYDGRKLYNEIKTVEYKASLKEATIISDYDRAKDILKEIQGNVESINFFNASIIGEILDRKHSFDKIGYSKELRIYELMPIEACR